MKRESNVRYILRLSLTLLVITSVMAALLAGVNAVTAPIIAAQTAEKTRQAIAEVLPGVTGYSQIDFTDDTGLVTRVYRETLSSGGNRYAVEVAPAGFGGSITMMVGVDTDGSVLGVRVIDHSETAGLGAVAAADSAAGQAFRDGFLGQTGSVTVTKDGGTVDALTGATITSRAVCQGVNAALTCAAGLS